jgi:hypothetical protein
LVPAKATSTVAFMGVDVAESAIAAPNESERRVARRGSRKSIVEDL